MALLKPSAGLISQRFGGAFYLEPVGYYTKASDGRPLKAYSSKYPGGIYAKDFHKGLDIYDDEGTPIYASENGTVVDATYDGTGSKFIRVRIQGQVNSFYTSSHCKSFSASKGDFVKRGELIAYMGHTGMATGDHNHFSVEFKEKHSDGITRRMYYDPARFMAAGTYKYGPNYGPGNGGQILPGGDLANDDRIYPIHNVSIGPGVNIRSTKYVTSTNIIAQTTSTITVPQLNEVIGGNWTVGGVTKNTWAKILYNGQDAYVATALIKPV